MKIYYIFAAVIFLFAYAIFHFGFRAGGAERLYRIGDELAFEIQPETEYSNGVTVHGYRRTSKLICFLCGEYERDDSRVWMTNAKYRRGDFIYTDFPQHDQARTDIVNLRTGETVEANVPADFRTGDDLSKLPEYDSRGLFKTNENKLTQEYVEANFRPLSTFTNRCVYAHVIFAVAFLLLAFPQFAAVMLDAFFKSNDPLDPANYHRDGIGD